ncbi:MAG: copper oxidase [Candidatus Rariloculaceae bacterium]
MTSSANDYRRGRKLAFPCLWLALAASGGWAQEMSHAEHDKMAIDAAGSTMNFNDAILPRDCAEPGPEVELMVYAGSEFADDVPGRTYGYSQHEYAAEPCSRITVTFINNDAIRHQWMIHGLPKYIYPGGMFYLEAAGGESRTGTFIVPSDDQTYLVHCDMTQHMEKGMKAQLVAGSGSGDLWSIPQVSDDYLHDAYLPDNSGRLFFLSIIAGLIGTVLLLSWRRLF